MAEGIYCGPLRLLAWEVSKRLNKAKVPCNLITGQEREEIDGAKHSSVTVEMADVTSEYQCAVIDEIQVCGRISCTLLHYVEHRKMWMNDNPKKGKKLSRKIGVLKIVHNHDSFIL